MFSKLNTELKWSLWKALSDLFLDTDLAERDYQYIALKVLETSIPPEDVVKILWLEVFPALCDNQRVSAGEWAGFDEDWLRQRILNVMAGREKACRPGGLLSVDRMIAFTEQTWERCCRYLPDSYAIIERPATRDIKRLPCNQGVVSAIWHRLRGG
jgi:hypothetical protein